MFAAAADLCDVASVLAVFAAILAALLCGTVAGGVRALFLLFVCHDRTFLSSLIKTVRGMTAGTYPKGNVFMLRLTARRVKLRQKEKGKR